MNSALKSFKHLEQFFPPDFADFLTKESRLYHILIDKDPRLDMLRQDIDDCLELAYRYNVVDADLKGKLKKGDWESWQAAINELKVAKYLEGIFGVDSLRWHPRGRKGKIGEFEVILGNLDKQIFIEVKTIFPRELEQMEGIIKQKLSRYAEQVPIPSFLSVHIEVPGISESFSGRKFKNFLTRELSAINPDNLKQKSIKLPDYKDNNTGLHLKIETLSITPKKEERACHIGIISAGARFVQNANYIRHSLNKAYAQLPASKQNPCLVILCSSTEFPIDEDDMLNTWLGTLAYDIYWHDNGTTSQPVPSRKRDGFVKLQYNRKLSAAGLYKEKFNGKDIEKNMEIYHNPWAFNPLDDFIFKDVRQLVKKNDQEMEWID